MLISMARVTALPEVIYFMKTFKHWKTKQNKKDRWTKGVRVKRLRKKDFKQPLVTFVF